MKNWNPHGLHNNGTSTFLNSTYMLVLNYYATFRFTIIFCMGIMHRVYGTTTQPISRFEQQQITAQYVMIN